MEMDEEGWVEWKGGECPVAEDVKVEVLYRDEDMSVMLLKSGLPVRDYDWTHDGVAGDIIAYRVIEEKAEQKAEQQIDPQLPDLALKLAEAVMSFCESGGNDRDAFHSMIEFAPDTMAAVIGKKETAKRCLQAMLGLSTRKQSAPKQAANDDAEEEAQKIADALGVRRDQIQTIEVSTAEELHETIDRIVDQARRVN